MFICLFILYSLYFNKNIGISFQQKNAMEIIYERKRDMMKAAKQQSSRHSNEDTKQIDITQIEINIK